MRKHDFVSGLFFLILGVGACIMAYRLKLGDVREPGAGLVPFGVSALLGLMSLGLSLRSLLHKTEAGREKETSLPGVAWGRLVITLCALLGYGLALEVLGFRLSTFLLMVVLLRMVGHQKWWLTGTISLLTVLCTYAIFEAWLGCPFPRGPFGI